MNENEEHWREYAMEGALLGLFMVSACGFATLLEHPASPLRHALPAPLTRRAWMGLAMGLTAVALVKSPWGQRSGAHMNPALTFTYFRLGRIRTADAGGYALGQFIGGAAGIGLAHLILGGLAADPSVRYAVTLPGASGVATAFVAEVVISGLLMLVVLVLSNQPHLARFTPWCCGVLIAAYIILEAPLSGMSMNPARSFASALGARQWSSLWIYFVAPPIGMLAAAEIYLRAAGAQRVLCAKLDHDNPTRCIFLCRWPAS